MKKKLTDMALYGVIVAAVALGISEVYDKTMDRKRDKKIESLRNEMDNELQTWQNTLDEYVITRDSLIDAWYDFNYRVSARYTNNREKRNEVLIPEYKQYIKKCEALDSAKYANTCASRKRLDSLQMIITTLENQR